MRSGIFRGGNPPHSPGVYLKGKRIAFISTSDWSRVDQIAYLCIVDRHQALGRVLGRQEVNELLGEL